MGLWDKFKKQKQPTIETATLEEVTNMTPEELENMINNVPRTEEGIEKLRQVQTRLVKESKNKENETFSRMNAEVAKAEKIAIAQRRKIYNDADEINERLREVQNLSGNRRAMSVAREEAARLQEEFREREKRIQQESMKKENPIRQPKQEGPRPEVGSDEYWKTIVLRPRLEELIDYGMSNEKVQEFYQRMLQEISQKKGKISNREIHSYIISETQKEIRNFNKSNQNIIGMNEEHKGK